MQPGVLRAEGLETPRRRLMYKYSVSPIGREGLPIRSDHYVLTGSISNQFAEISFGRSGFGSELWVAQADGPGYLAGDTWLRVEMASGDKLEGWVAIKHEGREVGILGSIVSIQEKRDEINVTVSASAPGYRTEIVNLTLPKDDR